MGEENILLTSTLKAADLRASVSNNVSPVSSEDSIILPVFVSEHDYPQQLTNDVIWLPIWDGMLEPLWLKSLIVLK